MTSSRLDFVLLLTGAAIVASPTTAHAAQARDDDDKPAGPEKATAALGLQRAHVHPDGDDDKPVVRTAGAAPRRADDDDDEDDGPAPKGEIVVHAQRLDRARAAVEPSLGASTYTLTNDAVEKRPGGETTTLAQILLQAPGVTQSGSGSLHVRGQGDLQYRIDNVIVPDGLGDLGESLSARFVDRVQLVAGALPAQYGLHAGGVVNITTKSGAFDRGGQLEVYGGTQGEIEPAFEYGGAFGSTNVFASGSYRHHDAGLSAPDRSGVPTHDRTDQFDGLAYVDHIVDADTRVSLVVGTSNERYQLPALAGDTNARGSETQNADYALAGLLRTDGKLTVQASAFGRYSQLNTIDDRVAPSLLQSADSDGLSGGVQLEAAYVASARHTLRGGAVFSFDGGQTRSSILGNTAYSTEHRTIVTGFVQDEWRPVGGVVVNGGMRFDHASGTGGGDQVSPRLNVIWSLGGGIDLHAGYARYFVPASQDALATAPETPDAASNDLRHETDEYYDVGLQRSRGGLTLGIDAYVRRSRDLLADVPMGQGSRQAFFNFARGRSEGFELTMTYAEGPFAAWSNLGVARIEGRDIVSSLTLFSPAELANVAGRYVPTDQDQAITASGGVSYRLDRVRVSADMLYGSGHRASLPGGPVNAATLPAYAQVNVAGLFRLGGLKGKPLNLRLDVINLVDARYRLRDGTELGGGTLQFARGRGVFFGVEQIF